MFSRNSRRVRPGVQNAAAVKKTMEIVAQTCREFKNDPKAPAYIAEY